MKILSEYYINGRFTGENGGYVYKAELEIISKYTYIHFTNGLMWETIEKSKKFDLEVAHFEYTGYKVSNW